MTRRISAVAVWRSRLSRSSLSRRVFSMAMTACFAKFVTSSICLSVNGRTSYRADQLVFLEHGNCDVGSCTAEFPDWIEQRVLRGSVPHVDDLPRAQEMLKRTSSARLKRTAP
jgi:hypothetical protein